MYIVYLYFCGYDSNESYKFAILFHYNYTFHT